MGATQKLLSPRNAFKRPLYSELRLHLDWLMQAAGSSLRKSLSCLNYANHALLLQRHSNVTCSKQRGRDKALHCSRQSANKLQAQSALEISLQTCDPMLNAACRLARQSKRSCDQLCCSWLWPHRKYDGLYPLKSSATLKRYVTKGYVIATHFSKTCLRTVTKPNTTLSSQHAIFQNANERSCPGQVSLFHAPRIDPLHKKVSFVTLDWTLLSGELK